MLLKLTIVRTVASPCRLYVVTVSELFIFSETIVVYAMFLARPILSSLFRYEQLNDVPFSSAFFSYKPVLKNFCHETVISVLVWENQHFYFQVRDLNWNIQPNILKFDKCRGTSGNRILKCAVLVSHNTRRPCQSHL